jgi:hypothetical protein
MLYYLVHIMLDLMTIITILHKEIYYGTINTKRIV